jgi:molybdate transport system ATP-binding protein
MSSGEGWAVLGPNGAGKSTFLRLLGGEEHAASGEVRRFGVAGPPGASLARSRVALLGPELQARHRFDASGEEVVLSGFEGSVGLAVPATEAQRARASEVLDALGLSALAGRRIHALSYGEVRKLLLARALVRRPGVLLLDEPASGLDPGARRWMREAVERAAAEGTAIVIATHHEDEIPSGVTHVARIEAGRLRAS